MKTARNAALVFFVALSVMLALHEPADEVGPGTSAYNPLSGSITSGTAPFAAYYTAGNTLSSTSALQFAATEVVINETGSAAMDFRVEGDTNANLLFVDASTDRVGIGTSTPATELEVTSTDAGAAAGPVLNLYRNSASPDINDVIGALSFDGNTDAPTRITYAQIAGSIHEPTAAIAQGELQLSWCDMGSCGKKAMLGSVGSSGGGTVVLASFADQAVADFGIGLIAHEDFNEDRIVLVVADNDGDAFFGIAGFGLASFTNERVTECVAGVATLDVIATQNTIDAGGAACIVTLSETTAASLVSTYNIAGWFATITVTNTAGGGVIFPDSANVSNVPVLCSTAGLQEGGSLSIVYANRANDLWLGTSCVQN